MLEYLYEKLARVDDVDELYVVTNARFSGEFRAWAASAERPLPVVVHDDGTTSNEDRLGAIGDIQFLIERARLAGENLLVVAGDNLFDFELVDFVSFWRSKPGSAAICVHDVGDPARMKEYSMVVLDDDDRVTYFEEKPQAPATTLAAIAVYLYPAAHAALVEEYLASGNPPDQPGRFVAWLYSRQPVYAYRFSGDWLDIGDREQLFDADNRMRERAGLPLRAEYSLEK
jgi:glucose-1-phosphate thymidylyltransferase